jgi:hypothetical protein
MVEDLSKEPPIFDQSVVPPGRDPRHLLSMAQVFLSPRNSPCTLAPCFSNSGTLLFWRYRIQYNVTEHPVHFFDILSPRDHCLFHVVHGKVPFTPTTPYTLTPLRLKGLNQVCTMSREKAGYSFKPHKPLCTSSDFFSMLKESVSIPDHLCRHGL